MREKPVVLVEDLWAELGIERPSTLLKPMPDVTLKLSRPVHQSAAALALMVLLHVLLGMGLFAQFGGAKSTATMGGGAALSRANSTHEVTSVLILVDEPAMSSIDENTKSDDQLSTQAVVVTDLGIQDVVTQGKATVPSAANGPGSQPRTLQDIYLGQIKARIERAWMGSQGARLALGHCKVTVQQGKQGEVIEVRFDRCVATAAWKNALVAAIRYASPLPAPPEEKVFSEEIKLEF